MTNTDPAYSPARATKERMDSETNAMLAVVARLEPALVPVIIREALGQALLTSPDVTLSAVAAVEDALHAALLAHRS